MPATMDQRSCAQAWRVLCTVTSHVMKNNNDQPLDAPMSQAIRKQTVMNAQVDASTFYDDRT